MSRQSTRARPHCSSSSAGSASYQVVSGATSPIYHLPQDSYANAEIANNYRKKHRDNDENIVREHHNYYNIQQPCCNKDSPPSYQYFNDRDERKSYGPIDNTFSEDSSYYDYHKSYEIDGPFYSKQEKRFVNNVYSEYESDFPITHAITGKKYQRPDFRHHNRSNYHSNVKESHVVINKDGLRGGLDRVYPEQPLTRPIPEEISTLPKHVEPSRLSDRAESMGSSGVGSAIVDGCGGHCVTFENVCSYVLQIFFVMGILIGVSLCIAGVSLRRTKSRDLQVLRYIGAMSAVVCAVLLLIQCRVRKALRNRKRNIRVMRSATIPMCDMRPTQQPLINLRTEDRAVILPASVQPRQQELPDEQGIPWWRRTDLQENLS